MDNCLASTRTYFDEFLAGRSRVLAISGVGARATLQLTYAKDGWFVEQIRGRSNLPFEEDLASSAFAPWPALREFVRQFGALPPPAVCSV